MQQYTIKATILNLEDFIRKLDPRFFPRVIANRQRRIEKLREQIEKEDK